VFDSLHPDRIVFSDNALSTKKLYLLCDSDSGHYNVIINIKAAMAKRYICNACDNTIKHTNVTKFAFCVLQRHPVQRIRKSIVEHAIGGFSVRNVYRNISK
jgi:hypothetical protein